MTPKPVSGIYAAVLTPRTADESIDVAALTQLVRFLMDQGISRYALNGATGEFCLTTAAQLKVLLATVHEASNGQAEMLCGVGAAGTALAIELAAIAHQAGVQALLLPMPYFFPYAQQDLDAFSRAVAAATPLPILLYNLPQFTSGLDKETVHALIAEVHNIIGIKDSSGSLDILRHLTEHLPDACRIVGNDCALAPALQQDLCDGVVSGVACALPEAILQLYAEAHNTPSKAFQNAANLLDQFIEQLNPFPTPWGLKYCVQARNITPATFAQPQTAQRQIQQQTFTQWFKTWHKQHFNTGSDQ